jgi:hypothetical protein
MYLDHLFHIPRFKKKKKKRKKEKLNTSCCSFHKSNIFINQLNKNHPRGLLIALMMEAARTSETLANFYQTTRRYNPEDSHLRSLPCSQEPATRPYPEPVEYSPHTHTFKISTLITYLHLYLGLFPSGFPTKRYINVK